MFNWRVVVKDQFGGYVEIGPWTVLANAEAYARRLHEEYDRSNPEYTIKFETRDS